MTKLNIVRDESTVDRIIQFCENIDQTGYNVMAVYGQAGTGKTMMLKKVSECLRQKFNIAAPTGIAASRIEQMGIKSFLADEPKTIHRLLEYTKGEKDEYGEYIKGKEPGPKRNGSNPLENHITLIDEASMLGRELYRNLINAMPYSHKIVLFGDERQLPPVKEKGNSVLLDLLNDYDAPNIELTKVHRQEEGGGIISNAHAINRGEIPKDNGKDFIVKDLPLMQNSNVFFKDISKHININNYIESNYQVICPTNAYCFKLNKFFQERFSENDPNKNYINCIFSKEGEGRLYEGDKIVFTENDYDLGFYNGNTGHVKEIIYNNVIYFRLEGSNKTITYPIPKMKKNQKHPRLKILLGYVVTTHKTQSKEYEEILAIYANDIGGAGNRRNLYTAVTRAKKKSLLLAEKYKLPEIIKNNGF